MDYLKFFGLTDDPFRLTPDPAYYFPSSEHDEILASLDYAIEHKEGFSVIFGKPGTGKTTVLRVIMERWRDRADIALIMTPRLSPEEFLQAVLEDLLVKPGDTNKNELLKAFRDFLTKRSQSDRRVIIIVDEAQSLPDETLEELRLLSNLETDREKLLQIILLGQPELAQRLQKGHLSQLDQRITIRSTLKPLDREEINHYINFRLIKAGKGKAIFDASAKKKIYRYSGGIPRLVNALSSRAVMAAFVEGSPVINKHHVDLAMAHLRDKTLPGKRLVYGSYGVLALMLALFTATCIYYLAARPHKAESTAATQASSQDHLLKKIVALPPKGVYEKVTVAVLTANIRNEPTIDSRIIVQAPKGTIFETSGTSLDQTGNVWYRVDMPNGRKGWASQEIVTVKR